MWWFDTIKDKVQQIKEQSVSKLKSRKDIYKRAEAKRLPVILCPEVYKLIVIWKFQGYQPPAIFYGNGEAVEELR